MTSRRRVLFLPAALLIAIAAAPASAQAATARVENGELIVEAAPGESNRITVNEWVGGPTEEFVDGFDVSENGGGQLTAGAGCQDEGFSNTYVICRFRSEIGSIRMSLGDMNDYGSLDLGDDPGPYSPPWTGPSVIDGGSGADELRGSYGTDEIDGGQGPDDLTGGPGEDTATYAKRGSVSVDIDDQPDDGNTGDGPGGARDNVRTDVENLTGGGGDDLLRGGVGDNRLTGGAGNDILDGGDGGDTMFGGSGTDRVTYATRAAGVTVDIDAVADDGSASDAGAGGGRDNVRGDVENLSGGSGPDSLTGGGAANTLDGGAGPDTLFGGGGTDTVTYATRGIAVSADIDAVPDDGSASDGPLGARDNVRGDIESLVGGTGADSLTGNAVANTLTGGPGADSLFGLAGDDRFEARDGVTDARIACGAQSDTVTADTADLADPD